MKIRKAEAHEKRHYALFNPVHPLFGYVSGVPTVLSGIRTRYTVAVESLFEGPGQPKYEAILPHGLHLIGDRVHTVLAVSQGDLLERLSQGLETCGPECEGV